MKERIKEIRLTLELNQSEFGEKIGIGQAGVSAIEKGLRGITDRNIQLICEKLSINEDWLRNGNGEMFIDIPQEDEYFKAATSISKDNDTLAMQVIIDYWKLSKESKQLFKNYILNLAEKIKETE